MRLCMEANRLRLNIFFFLMMRILLNCQIPRKKKTTYDVMDVALALQYANRRKETKNPEP